MPQPILAQIDDGLIEFSLTLSSVCPAMHTYLTDLFHASHSIESLSYAVSDNPASFAANDTWGFLATKLYGVCQGNALHLRMESKY